MNFKLTLSLGFCLLAILGCSSSFLKYNREETFFKNEEFERSVKIESVEEKKDTTSVIPQTAVVEDKPSNKKEMSGVDTSFQNQSDKITVSSKIKPKVTKKIKSKNKTAGVVTPDVLKREPEIEDTEGFAPGQRRPLVDPFKVGEKVVHAVKFFAAEAGRLSLEVLPLAQVNGRSSYQFSVGLKSSRIFSNFYSVDDQVDIFLDYNDLLPYVLKINIKESGKLAKAQSYFDHTTHRARFWEKKYTEKNGEEEKKYEWDITPFSQNAYSGLFYMRLFTWKVGKEISFHVAEDEKNIIFKGTAVAKETLETEAGTFQAFKVKASIMSRGALSQTGDVFIWISDDDRKYILRVEAKIKIGSLVSEVVEINPGR